MRDLLNDLDAGRFLSDPNPLQRARNAMQTPLPKRFYVEAAVAAAEEGGFAVLLDGKPVKVPSGQKLLLPTEAAATLVVAEFLAQGETINPTSMPVLRLANTVIDGVAADPQAVLEDIQRYASSDLICYRAGEPEKLVVRQAEAWDPALDWARSRLGARFFLAEGVMHVEQPREAVAAVGLQLASRDDPFRLASLHVMTTLLGSALLALMVEDDALDPSEAWRAAHVDEDWNIDQWGEDVEATARRASRERDFLAAVALLSAL